VHAGELLSVAALDRLEQIATRASSLLETNRGLLDRFLDGRADLRFYRPAFGTIVSPKLRRGAADDFCALLRQKYETSVVPGKFFEMPQHFRVGIGGNTEMTAGGLRRLARALDEYGARH
jgi:aspartate/methionine/tyrosine aminotransferase